MVISAPDGRIAHTNPALKEILGYSEDDLAGRALSELFAPDDQPAVQRGCHRLLAGDEPWFRTHLQLRRKDGETVHTQLTVSALRDATHQPRCLVMMVDDHTELRLVLDRLNHQALHDLRTGLPNRHYFVSHLEEVLGGLEPSETVTLLHLDLEGFSVINDGLGHHHGDQVLDLVARRLESVVADQHAMVARIGGDEYAILLRPANPIPDVGRLAETVNTELVRTVYRDDVGVAVTARIGAVQRQAGTTNPAELMRAAGAALRWARDNGTRWAMFDADTAAADRAELRLAAGLPGAMQAGGLRVEYQPVAALDGGELVGVEAVLSWHHSALVVLSPDRCVQLAERTGAGHAVGRYLLDTAAEQTALWQRKLWQQNRQERLPPTVIGLSHPQAQDPGLVVQTRAVLDRTGLAPDALELSVPAAALRPVGNAPRTVARDNLELLAGLGVRTAVHDFGGDIRELALLADVGVAAVRITRSVAQQVADGPSAITAQVLDALLTSLRSAEINVVACLVDTEPVASWWRGAGANHAVGALFGRPGPAQRAEHLLGPHQDRLGAGMR
jgi:diguanylate cyclase (GGDEF)-like protein/PAS domain S-box-containing protein